MHTGHLAVERFEVADRQLNAVYRQALSKAAMIPEGAALRKRLIEAQRIWVQFRDRNCEVEGDYMGGAQAWKSTYAVSCRARLTEQRTQELQEIVKR